MEIRLLPSQSLGDRGPIFRCSVDQTVNSFFSLEFSEAGILGGARIIIRMCPCALRNTLVFCSAFTAQAQDMVKNRAQRNLVKERIFCQPWPISLLSWNFRARGTNWCKYADNSCCLLLSYEYQSLLLFRSVLSSSALMMLWQACRYGTISDPLQFLTPIKLRKILVTPKTNKNLVSEI